MYKESDLLESFRNWLVATFRSRVEAKSCYLVEQVAIVQRMERSLARHLVEIHSLERCQRVDSMKGNPPMDTRREGKRLVAEGIVADSEAGIVALAVAVAAVAEIVVRLQQRESLQVRSARMRLAVLAVQAARVQDAQS
jgi:hypothetical protein